LIKKKKKKIAVRGKCPTITQPTTKRNVKRNIKTRSLTTDPDMREVREREKSEIEEQYLMTL